MRKDERSSKVISLTNVAMVNIFKENGVRFLPNEQKKASKEVENLLSIEFEGKNAVLLFYKSFDGGVFPDGAFLYRDSFFNVEKNDYNMLDIGCFFRVSELEIFSRLISLTKSSRDKEACLLSFANDSSGNIYCIEEDSGKVFYIHHEEEECVTEVAPSFLLFCENIKGEMR
jgi:hypothetical protein